MPNLPGLVPARLRSVEGLTSPINNPRAVLSHGGPRDATVHFDTYRILQRHRAVSLPQHAFLVGLCVHTAVNYLSKSDKY